MRNLAFAAICIGSMALLACGGGGSDPDAMIIDPGVDSGVTFDAPAAACNPVSNTGCDDPTHKCTYIVESTDPFLGRTACAPDGTVPLEGTCMRAEDGVDDCVGGTWCSGGTCAEICGSAPDTCGTDSTCVSFVGLFEDAEGTGLCQPSCNPVSVPSDCPEGEGCFLNLGTGAGSCAVGYSGSATDPYPENKMGAANCAASPGTQGCHCLYLNGCQNGYGCALNNEPGGTATGLECAFFCDVMGGGGPTCADAQLLGDMWRCAQISTFYSDSDQVPPEIGFCVNNEEWACFGCTDTTTVGCRIAVGTENCDCDQAMPQSTECLE